jgi:hypothetical protein
LEIDLQRGVEGELKRLILLFTHWVQASDVSITPSQPHGYWRWLDHTITYLNFKKEMWANIGCVLLEEPFFFPEKDWIPTPSDFSANVVVGKGYDTASETGQLLWQQVGQASRVSGLK